MAASAWAPCPRPLGPPPSGGACPRGGGFRPRVGVGKTPGGMLLHPPSLLAMVRSAPAESPLHWGSPAGSPRKQVCDNHRRTGAPAPGTLCNRPSTSGVHHHRHRGKLSVLQASNLLGWMLLHGMSRHRPSVALELCWPWRPLWAMWCVHRRPVRDRSVRASWPPRGSRGVRVGRAARGPSAARIDRIRWDHSG